MAKTGGRGVAIGSDVNGAAGLPGPRFGPFAAYGAKDDERRMAERRREIDEQTNGVAYDEPIRDYRWHRFDAADPGAYDEEEEDIWQAIAQYEAGFNPWIHRHPEATSPNRRSAGDGAGPDHPRPGRGRRHDQGLHRGGPAAFPVADDQIDDWPTELRAGYLAREAGHRAGEVAGRGDPQAGRPDQRHLGQVGADAAATTRR